MKRKNYSKELKTKVALAAIKGNQTANEIASEFGIHVRIQSIAPKPNTSKAHPQHKVYPYLLRNFDVTRSNQVWCSDLTYIRLAGGFVYLTAVIDWGRAMVNIFIERLWRSVKYEEIYVNEYKKLS